MLLMFHKGSSEQVLNTVLQQQCTQHLHGMSCKRGRGGGVGCDSDGEGLMRMGGGRGGGGDHRRANRCVQTEYLPPQRCSTSHTPLGGLPFLSHLQTNTLLSTTRPTSRCVGVGFNAPPCNGDVREAAAGIPCSPPAHTHTHTPAFATPTRELTFK